MKTTPKTQQELVRQILEVAHKPLQSADDYFEARSMLNAYLAGMYGTESDAVCRLRELRQLHLAFQIIRRQLAPQGAELCKFCMGMLDIEIDMVNRQLGKPGQEASCPKPDASPGPLLAWKGSVSQLLEMVCALFSTGLITQKDGSTLNFIQTIKAFEAFFGIKIPEPYKRRGILFERKRNVTAFLDYLKRAYQQSVKASVG